MRFVLGVCSALFPHFVFAQNSIPIIVLPDSDINDLQTNSQNKFNQSQEIIEDPSSGNINQETIPTNIVPGSAPSPKSFSDLADRISSAQVEHFGGEAGSLRVRLRGARAFEPSYYFNGLPLAGAGTSEQNIALLPVSNIGFINIYPDTPPFWLSSMGISGDIDLQSCRRINCFTYGKENKNDHLFKLTGRAGSYHYSQSSASYSLQLNKQNEIYSTIEYTQSKEDYPAFKNNNSSLNSSQGSYELLQNNDFKKLAGSIAVSSFHDYFGKIKFDFVYGIQDKGSPGEVGSISNTRVKRNLLLTTLNTDKLFSNSGLQWGTQLGVLYNIATSQDLQQGFVAQAKNSENYTIQGKSWFLLPSSVFSQEKSGISFEFLQSNQKTKTAVPANNSDDYNSNVEATRNDLRTSLFESIYIPVNKHYSLSANANIWGSFSQANANMACNYPGSSNNCSSNFQEQEKPIYGYTLSLQNKYDILIHFIRYSLSMRRPYLSEFYGAPEGILPNVKLLPESSKKIETGFRIPWGEIGYFHANDSNLIFLQQVNPVTSQYQNIENGFRDGVYFNSDYYILRYWKVYFTYQYLISKMILDNQETEVPRSARHFINAGTNLENILLGSIFEYQSFFGSYFNMNWQSPFYMDYANINKMEVPPIYNSGVSFCFASKEKSQIYTVSFDVYNILDETYSTVSNSTGSIKQMQTNGYIGYPPPGRRFYISMIGEF